MTCFGYMLPPIMDAIKIQKELYRDAYLFDTTTHAMMKCIAEKDENKDENCSKFHLLYMPMRNRMEIIRLILEEAEISYDFEVVGFKPWEESIKFTTIHGKCPVLRNYDARGHDLAQEGAITRYLAEKCNLAGSTLEEKAAIDSLYCFWFSTFRNNGISHDGEHFSIASLKNHPPLEASEIPIYTDTFRINNLSKTERSLMALGFFENILKKQSLLKSDYLVTSNRPSYVDLGLFYILLEMSEIDNIPDFSKRFDLPFLGKFLVHMSNRKQIKRYINSPTRMPRYARDEKSGTSTYIFVPGIGSPRYT